MDRSTFKYKRGLAGSLSSTKTPTPQGEELIDKALTLRQHVHLDEEGVEELEGVVTLLSEHFSSETNGKGE